MSSFRIRLVALVGFTAILAGGAGAQEENPGAKPIEEQLDRLEKILSGAAAEQRTEVIQRQVSEALEIVRKIRTEVQELAKAPGGDASTEAKIKENELSVIQTLRALLMAQEIFKQQGLVDQDGDGTGEYGWFGELAGVQATRGVGGIAGGRAPPFFTEKDLGTKDAGGRVQRFGYFFRVLLPGGGIGPAKAESRGPAGTGSPSDADNQEVRWVCYAWPVERGKTSIRTYYAGHQGEVYVTQGMKVPYSGTSREPDAAAALDAEGPNPANLDAGIGLAAAGLKAGDGNLWMPAATAERVLLPWPQRAAATVRTLLGGEEARGEEGRALAAGILSITHPSGKDASLGECEAKAVGQQVVATIRVNWKAGLLKIGHHTVVVWEFDQAGNSKALVKEASTAEAAGCAPRLDDYFRKELLPDLKSALGD